MTVERNLDEHSVTDAVIEQLADTPDVRLKEILTPPRARPSRADT